MSKPPNRTRPTGDSWKATTKPVESAPRTPSISIPGAKEMVTLPIDRDVLDFFQEEGPGWQERINEALRKAAKK